MKVKYAVPQRLVSDLIASGLASGEEDAMTKVASGEGLDALWADKNKKLIELEIAFQSNGGRGVDLAEEIDLLRGSIEEIDELIKTRDGEK